MTERVRGEGAAGEGEAVRVEVLRWRESGAGREEHTTAAALLLAASAICDVCFAPFALFWL